MINGGYTGPDGLDDDGNYAENHRFDYDENSTPDYLSEAADEADWLLAPVKVFYRQTTYDNWNPTHTGIWKLPVKDIVEARINLPNLEEAISKKKHEIVRTEDLE